jgi:hypothetical protein
MKTVNMFTCKISVAVSITLAILLLAGCRATQQLPVSTSYEVIETERIDTQIVILPADTQYVSIPIDCPDDSIYFGVGKTKTEIVIKDRILKIKTFTREDSIQIFNSYKQKFSKETAVKEVIVEKEVAKVPKFIIYSLVILLVLVLFAYRKQLLKIIRMLFGLF